LEWIYTRHRATICELSEDRRIVEFKEYPTNEEGYKNFIKRLNVLIEREYEVSAGAESTENTRYFMNGILKADVSVKVVNILRFKVVNEAVEKTDRHDART